MRIKTTKALAVFAALNMALSPILANAAPGSDAEWRPTVGDSELHTPSLSDPVYTHDGQGAMTNYGGEPGWGADDSSLDEVCGPGENRKYCGSGQNANYQNDARYEGVCGEGESEEECDARVGKNEGYNNESVYYGICGVGETPEECEARTGINQNYRNDARYDGMCPARPDETQEECKNRFSGGGSNQNYQLNMEDFNGEGSDIYSGIPGGNRGGSLYDGISNDRNGRNGGNGGNGGFYDQDGAWGDFGGYGGNEGDWDTLKNKQQEFNDAVAETVDKDGLYKDKEKRNALLTLIFCSLQIPFEGPRAVFGDKTCRWAVKNLCRFKVSRMKISGPSQCLGFAPWNM